ncbi:MAG: flavodoxin family protein [Thermodesulfobacteriota bacterium]
MKTVCVLGSPRSNGNSHALARHFCDRLENLGAEVQTFALNKLTYRGCQGCLVCKTKLDRCVLDDDLTPVLDAVRETDLLVMATPVYFGDITSQLKGFIDRMFSFFTPDYRTSEVKSRLAPGKKLVFIQVQGRPDESKFTDIFPRYGEFWDWYGINERYHLRSWGVRALGEIAKDREVFIKAEALAARIMQG